MIKKEKYILILLIIGLVLVIGWQGKGVQIKKAESQLIPADITGTGTKDDPFIIYNLAGLEKLGKEGYPLKGYYKLGKDIDARATQSKEYNNGQGWKPIGGIYDLKNKNWDAFSGTFDGQGHQISNLYSSSDEYGAGLFAMLNQGSIKNLNLVDFKIEAKVCTGTIVGFNNKGIIKNVHVKADLSSDKYGGNLVGISKDGIIKSSSARGSIQGEEVLGGLVGLNNGLIETSRATTSVQGKAISGGLVGLNKQLILRSFSTGDITGADYLGGIVGYNRGLVKNCYSSGNIKGGNQVGGIAGYNGGLINRTYAVGRISGSDNSTKAIAGNNKRVENSFYRIGMGEGYNAGKRKGILELQQEETFRDYDYEKDWDFKKVWGITEGERYPYLRNNRLDENNNFQTRKKKQKITEIDYWGPDIKGKGSKEKPFVIYTLEGLERIGEEGYPLDGYYKLGRDIDASLTKTKEYNQGQGWDGIGEVKFKSDYNKEFNGFTGVFDGQNHTIKNLFVRRLNESYCGLFSVIDKGLVKNLNLVNIDIKANDYVGGITAYNQGTIKNCIVKGKLKSDGTIGGVVADNIGIISDAHTVVSLESLSDVGGLAGYNSGEIVKSSVKGEIEGNIYVGGLVGQNAEGEINESYVRADIIGDYKTGGLAGVNEGLISNSYAKGSVDGYDRYAGGLVGYNGGKIGNTYAVSKVEGVGRVGGLVAYNKSEGKITNSYYLKNLSKKNNSDFGIGKSKEEMKKSSTFENWDLDNTWIINRDYPKLKWQNN